MSMYRFVRYGCAAAVVAGVCFASTHFARAAEAAQLYPLTPAWVADQTLYEVNLRSFSTEGTIDGFAKQLPRLQRLGVGTLWFMPINPIGQLNHAGKLGSPYAVKDYMKFNPEFGTLEQFKAVVDEAHRRGMYVIIDWVAAHTALDNIWVHQHPDWYKHDANGNLVPPMAAWHDVAALNYGSADMRKAMIDAMSFWVRDVGVDGFRCDSAEFVPVDFWVDARNALRKIKPIFMLAEGNNPQLVKYAFDAAYAWYLPPNMEGIVKGSKNVNDLKNFFKAEAKLLNGDGFRLYYTTNHDVNAWEGTTSELLDGGTDAFTVLTFTAPGMPLIYDGQEAGLDRRLNFFQKDPIVWHKDLKEANLYRTLAELKRNHLSLWSGVEHAPMKFIDSAPSVLAFERQVRNDRVVVMLNLGKQTAHITVPNEVAGLQPVLGGDAPATPGSKLDLPPWGYRVWATQP